MIFTIRWFCGLSVLWCTLLGCSGGRPPPLDTTLTFPQVSSQLSIQEVRALQTADIVLIGETHDHPQHHLIQADIIRRLKPKSVAFEMLNEAQQVHRLGLKDPSTWDKVLAWSKRGWPDFEMYRPVFEATVEVGAHIIAAHPNPETLRPLKLGGELPSLLRTTLKLDQPLPAKQQASLVKEIQRAHCGHASPVLVKAMVSAQRLKDTWMAQSILDSPKPIILIVGRGHINMDRGIPWAMKQLQPNHDFNLKVLSLAPEPVGHSTQRNHDVIEVQVKAHRNDDPCERFREQLKRLREHSPSPHSTDVKR